MHKPACCSGSIYQLVYSNIWHPQISSKFLTLWKWLPIRIIGEKSLFFRKNKDFAKLPQVCGQFFNFLEKKMHKNAIFDQEQQQNIQKISHTVEMTAY